MGPMPTELLDHCLDLADRAPSLHNSQPWTWFVQGPVLQLRAERARQIMATDPEGRDLMISCGAALRTLQVAAEAAGWPASVVRLPVVSDRDLVAEVRFRAGPASDEARVLARAVEDRRTDRRRPAGWPVPKERVERYQQVAADAGVLLTDLTDRGHDETVRRLLARGARLQGQHGRYHDELMHWTQVRDGLGVPAANRLRRADETDEAVEAGERPMPGRFPAGGLADFEPAPEDNVRWLLFSTTSDDRLCWLRTGEALQAVWLRTTVDGLTLVPYSQPLEVAGTRETLGHACLNDTSCPQLLVRLGWARLGAAPVPATPRAAHVAGRDLN